MFRRSAACASAPRWWCSPHNTPFLDLSTPWPSKASGVSAAFRLLNEGPGLFFGGFNYFQLRATPHAREIPNQPLDPNAQGHRKHSARLRQRAESISGDCRGVRVKVTKPQHRWAPLRSLGAKRIVANECLREYIELFGRQIIQVMF